MLTEENIESRTHFEKLINVLNTISRNYGIPVIVSTHPRTQKRIDNSNLKLHKLIKLCKPLGFFDYVNLQINSRAVLSDSGTITEEA